MISTVKKMFPFCPMLMMLIACGKKVEDGSSTERRRLDLNLPETLSMHSEATGGFSRIDGTYIVPRDGDIELPVLISSNGATGSFEVKLELNMYDGDVEFDCVWKGEGNSYRFVSCQDPDGRDLGLTADNLNSFTFPIDQGKTLRLRLEAAPVGTTVKASALMPVSWK
jgi:hypothetical protein